MTSIKKRKDYVIVVGIRCGDGTRIEAEDSLTELKSLVISAGAVIRDAVFCDLRKINSATFIGRGKVNEITEKIKKYKTTMVVLNRGCPRHQQRTLEGLWDTHVIDRTGIILDIFATRAATREGILQVELAQLEYRLPRLTRMWEHLSRLGAGIGTRGPGETQLEVDRRKIRLRLDKIRSDLKRVRNRRRIQRKARKRASITTVALVGYTNAGKSTLLNALTGSSVIVQDQLFATLDPKIRTLILPNQQKIIISDTVGFISKLPHQLVAAFRATLEEVMESDLLIHVIDGSSDNRDHQIQQVDSVLNDLGVTDKEMILAFNKADLSPEMIPGPVWGDGSIPAFSISAETGTGIEDLLRYLTEFNARKTQAIRYLIPYENSDVAAAIQSSTEVILTEYDDKGVIIEARVTPRYAHQFREFRVEK